MKYFPDKIIIRHLFSMLFMLIFCSNTAFAQENNNIDIQRGQIEKEINVLMTTTNWQNKEESEKATAKLTELANKLASLTTNQVLDSLKNTDMDFSLGLMDEIKRDLDEPAERTSGTDSSRIILYLGASDTESYEELSRLYDFPNMSIVYINGYNLNKTIDLSEIIGTLISSSQIKELYIVGFSDAITQIPDIIGELSNLEVLVLNGNSLTEIPESVADLKNLNILYLNENPVAKLPEQIGNCKALKYIGLRKTQIPTEEFTRLKSLLPNCEILK